MTYHVAYIDLKARVARLDTGDTVPITTMIDSANEDTDDPRDVVTVVCGPTACGEWIAANVTDEERAEARRYDA